MEEQYLRQSLVLGQESPHILRKKTVGILGCGALGSAAAHLLTRCGVGTLILVDGDSVEIHNLARQHLYGKEDVGQPKVEALAKQLARINPDAQINTHHRYMQQQGDFSVFRDCDIIIDGLDTHAIRRLLDTFCKDEHTWWVHGAAIQEKGTCIALNGVDRPYSALYDANAPDTHCADSGVLVTTTTLVATVQTRLALQLLLGVTPDYTLYRIDGIECQGYPVK